jgi:integrase
MDGKVRRAGPMRRKAKSPALPPAPTVVNGEVPPRRVTNAERRPREYLTREEIERLIAAAAKRPGARYGHRDATMILLAYRHGLRASELCAARWDMIDLAKGRYHVTRRKNGRPSVHVIRGSEIRALRRLKREQSPPSPYLFTTERKAPVTPAGFRKLTTVIGEAAGLPFPVHPHMLRHACGFALANDGQDTRAIQEWLGHQNIQHTTRYIELSPARFRGFFEQED